MARITRPRGTNDVLPQDVGLWQELEIRIRNICGNYGYQEIRTPVFEHTELFQRGVGETTDIVEKEMYTFLDRGKRSITLRPEGTAPVVRAYLENKLDSLPAPVKLFYFAPMFRYERPQAGRFRQHTQFGLEALGSSDPLLDVEAITVPIEIYRSCGFDDFKVLLNSIGCPACRGEYRERLIEYVQPFQDQLCSSCQSRLERNPLRLLDCKAENCRRLLAEAPVITEFLCPDCQEHFAQVCTFLQQLGIEYEIDPYLVRGLDYYTRTVFEVTSAQLGSQNAVGAGGRYDGLVEECGGRPTPAVGFAGGVERLLLALKNQKAELIEIRKPMAFVVHFGGKTKLEAAKLAHSLRRQGFWIETDYLDRSVKAQMKAANRFGCRYVLVLGEDELAGNQVLLRNMQTGSEEMYALDNQEQIGRVLGGKP